MGALSLKRELRKLLEKDDDLRRWLVLKIVESIKKDDALRMSFVTAIRDGVVVKGIESLRKHNDKCSSERCDVEVLDGSAQSQDRDSQAHRER